MGRGRAKAKQTKVARQLKYNSSGTDLDALRKEILGEQDESEDKESDDYEDLYAKYADLADEDDESDR